MGGRTERSSVTSPDVPRPGHHLWNQGPTIATEQLSCLVCGTVQIDQLVPLCSDRCISRAHQEVQANAAEVRLGRQGEERDALLRRNAQLMDAVLDRQRQSGARTTVETDRGSDDGPGRRSARA